MEGEKVSFPCDSCEFVSKTKKVYKKHAISHSTDLQICSDCDKQFASSKGLILHVAKAHKEKTNSDALVGEELLSEDRMPKEDLVNGMDVHLYPIGSQEKIEKKSVKSKASKLVVKRSKKSSKNKNSFITAEFTVNPMPVDLNQEYTSNYDQIKVSSEDFWSGDEFYKLKWLEDTAATKWLEDLITINPAIDPIPATMCSDNCHCRVCRPCLMPCCENSAVRSGKCCDPSTLGRCLQPYDTQCFAPCCHFSVQLKDNFKFQGGCLVEEENGVKLINPLQELELENVDEEVRAINERCEETVLEDTASIDKYLDESDKDIKYIPQILTNNNIQMYLDKKLGKISLLPSDHNDSHMPIKEVISLSPQRKDFFKFYYDLSLPPGCRIVHKKDADSKRVAYLYRSKCGKLFQTKLELLSFVEESKKDLVFKETKLIRNYKMHGYEPRISFAHENPVEVKINKIPPDAENPVEVKINKIPPDALELDEFTNQVESTAILNAIVEDEVHPFYERNEKMARSATEVGKCVTAEGIVNPESNESKVEVLIYKVPPDAVELDNSTVEDEVCPVDERNEEIARTATSEAKVNPARNESKVENKIMESIAKSKVINIRESNGNKLKTTSVDSTVKAKVIYESNGNKVDKCGQALDLPFSESNNKLDLDLNETKREALAKPRSKICRCDECDLALSMSDITKHIITVHSGEKLKRCMKCKSGLMSLASLEAHTREHHVEEVQLRQGREIARKETSGKKMKQGRAIGLTDKTSVADKKLYVEEDESNVCPEQLSSNKLGTNSRQRKSREGRETLITHKDDLNIKKQKENPTTRESNSRKRKTDGDGGNSYKKSVMSDVLNDAHKEVGMVSSTVKLERKHEVTKNTLNRRQKQEGILGVEERELLNSEPPQVAVKLPIPEIAKKTSSNRKRRLEKITNEEVNIKTSDLNDSVETLDKIEDFLNKSAKPSVEKSGSKKNTLGVIPRESTRKRTSSLCTPPPSISKKKVSNKINSLDVDKKSLKRSKSASNLIPTTSGTARKRSRTKTFDITDEVKDTDPSHPTSSVNLRIKGRTLKGSKKLTDMGPLIHHEKLQLNDSSIITDCVKGEILMYKSRIKESYFRVSADFSTLDGVSDKEDDGQPTSSETLRKKGRNNKGKKKLVPFPPMHLYHEETVEGNLVNLYEPQVQSKDSYFKISSN